jgi:hypothetical protein
MKLTCLTTFIALALAGCASDQKLFGPSLLPRAEAAEAISDPARRDDAVGKVAIDAIHDGDAVAANEAIDHMRAGPIRDDVAARCAQWLAKHWRAGEGTAIAKKIGDASLRDQVLLSIALGRP